MHPDAPFLVKTHLLEARQGGYATYRIPGIVVTPSGTVLAYCEARKNARGDWGAIDILLLRSTDGGCSWEAPRTMMPPDHHVAKNPVALQQGLAMADERTTNNPVAIADWQNGAVHFLYCAEYARCFYTRSDDGGATFSRAIDITATFERYRAEYDWRVIATGPGHGIQLRDGRLLVPIWMSTGTGPHAHRPSAVSVIYSDDHGKTWDRGDIVAQHSGATPNPSETAAVQLVDGRVMLNMRNEARQNRRLVAFSGDGAVGWTAPVFDRELFEPVCFASLIRISVRPGQRKDRLLFANPDSRNRARGPNVSRAWPRENLTLRLSYDEGATWPVARPLEPGISGYADLAVGIEGTIYCLYEDGGLAGDMYHSAHLSLARFNLEWLTDGQDSTTS